MNARQYIFMQKMFTLNSTQTINSLRAHLQCSEKTLRNDIKYINTYLQENHFQTHIIAKQGSGIRLILGKNEETYLRFFLDTKRLEIHPELYRFYQGMLAILFSNKVYTMDTLAEVLYSNITQLKTDTLQWESMLSTFALKLVKKPHLYIEGKEQQIRLFTLNYFYRLATSAMIQNIEPYFLQENKAFFLNIIHIYEKQAGIQFTTNAKHHFCIYLGMAIKRIKLHHTIEDTLSVKLSCKEIKNMIENTFHIRFNTIETTYLLQVFGNGATQLNERYIRNHSVSLSTTALANKFITELEANYHHMFNKILYKPFCILLETAIQRKRYHTPILNYYGNQVKYNYLTAFLCVIRIFFDQTELSDLQIYEAEYTRLTMLLVPYFKELEMQFVFHAGMIVNCSIEQAYYGKYIIEKAIPGLVIEEILSEQDLENRKYKEDLFISFTYVKTNQPYVQISNIIQDEDIHKIKVSIEELKANKRKQKVIHKKKIQMDKLETLDQLIPLMYNDILSLCKVEKTLVAFAKQLYTIKIFHDDCVIIPFYEHTITEDYLLIYEMKKDFFVEGTRIHHIHMLCMKKRSFCELHEYLMNYKQKLSKS